MTIETLMGKTRFIYFDNVKFALIALVVCGHFIDIDAVTTHRMARAAFVYIYSFHMPLFIFISGLFVEPKKIDSNKAIERVVLYCILGFSVRVFLLIVTTILGKPPAFSLLSASGVSWFMFALAAFYTLAFFLRNINPRIILVASLALGLIVGYDSSIGDFLYLSRIVVFFPFFWLGTMLQPSQIEAITNRKSIKIIGALVLIGFALICIFQTSEIYNYRGLFTGRNSFKSISAIQDCSALNRLLAYSMSAVMCASVLAITPHSKLPIISNGGKRTLQIYLIHYAFIYVLQYFGLLVFVNNLPGFGWLIVFIIGILVTLVLSIKWLEAPFVALNNSIRSKTL